MKNILVYGWYHQGNVGDDLFSTAFKTLFPEYNFTFVNNLKTVDVENADAIFIGGGSFLNQHLQMESTTFDSLKKKKLFYIGVGAETSVHPHHAELLALAQLIVVRAPNQVERVLPFNKKVIFAPDLVYSLSQNISCPRDKSILILPNIAVVPKWSDPYWKHASWHYFKSEFCQFLDALIGYGYKINFFPMCQNNQLDDYSAAMELVNHMEKRNAKYYLQTTNNPIELLQLFASASAVITQRYHGIILSEMTATPCVSIYHHDKLKEAYPGNAESISYYGLSKKDLFDNLEKVKYKNNKLPIEMNSFDIVKESVISSIES